MIKTKEELLGTKIAFFEGSALVERYLNLAEELGVEVMCAGTDIYELAIENKSAWLCINSKGGSVYQRRDYDLADPDFSGKSPINYRELTLADFEPEAGHGDNQIHTKEWLTGIKVRINGREQWDRLKELCESVGLEHATWHGCDFYSNSTTFMCGYKGKFLATGYWEDTSETSEEFANLREVQYEDLFVVEGKEQEEGVVIGKYKYSPVSMDTCLFSLKKGFESGNLYYSDDNVKFYPVENQTQLAEGFHTITLYIREEVKWQDEVVDLLKRSRVPNTDNSYYAHPSADLLENEGLFLEAARIALRSLGELK